MKPTGLFRTTRLSRGQGKRFIYSNHSGGGTGTCHNHCISAPRNPASSQQGPLLGESGSPGSRHPAPHALPARPAAATCRRRAGRAPAQPLQPRGHTNPPGSGKERLRTPTAGPAETRPSPGRWLQGWRAEGMGRERRYRRYQLPPCGGEGDERAGGHRKQSPVKASVKIFIGTYRF